MVYSIDNQESFENVDSWLREIKTHSNPDVKVFLVGNKTDLEEKRKVDKEVALKYKTDHNLDYLTETSAKTGFNAKSVFVEAAKVLYKDYLKYKEKLDRSRSSSTASKKVDSSFNQANNNNMRLSKKKEDKPPTKKGCC